MQKKFRVKSIKEINDLLDQWHTGKSKKSMEEFLGFSKEQFNLFLSDSVKFCKKYNILDNDIEDDEDDASQI